MTALCVARRILEAATSSMAFVTCRVERMAFILRRRSRSPRGILFYGTACYGDAGGVALRGSLRLAPQGDIVYSKIIIHFFVLNEVSSLFSISSASLGISVERVSRRS